MVNPKMRQMIVKASPDSPLSSGSIILRQAKLNSMTCKQQVFSTKYSLTLPTQSLLFIEKVLTEGEVPQEEWSDGLELWAKEYLRGEGRSSGFRHV